MKMYHFGHADKLDRRIFNSELRETNLLCPRLRLKGLAMWSSDPVFGAM